jgi:hypothetical protein
MVSFIADPRIKQAQAQRQALMAQALTPYQLPANPYGASPWAGNLQRLAAALGARWAGQDAAGIQEKQRAARAKIYGSLFQAGQARTPAGGQYFEQVQAPVPGIAPGPGATQTQIRRVAIGDDGREVPASAVSAETAQIAGIDLAQYKAMRDKARTEGDVATQEAIEKELTGRLSAVEQARALDPTNEDLYRQSQEIRGILSPVTLAEERDVAIREQMRFKRGEVAKKESEKRALDAKMKADERAVGRGLDRDEINASIWLFRNETTRSERTADQIAREDRHALALIEIAKQRLGVTLDAEERAHLEFIAREEIRLKTTLTSEDRAEIRTKNRENRALLKTLAAEKRAVAAAIEAEERRLKVTISAEARAKIAGEVRGDFDDQRAEIRAIAADKRKRVKVFNRITKTEDSITQEMMDQDQKSKTPEYTYDESDKGWPKSVSLVTPVNGRTTTFVTKKELLEDINRAEGDRLFQPLPGVSLKDGKLVSVSTPAVQRDVTIEKQLGVAAETAFAIAEAVALRERVREFRGMTGLSGAAGRVIGGITGQTVSEGAGDWVSEQLTGVSQKQLQAFATDAAKIVAPFIPIITGEESGRFTEAERNETKEATAVLKLMKSPQQVLGAIGVILSSYATRLAKVQYVMGNRIDVTSGDGILYQMRRFKKWGLDDDEIANTIRKIQIAYGELNDLPADAYKSFTGRNK